MPLILNRPQNQFQMIEAKHLFERNKIINELKEYLKNFIDIIKKTHDKFKYM